MARFVEDEPTVLKRFSNGRAKPPQDAGFAQTLADDCSPSIG
jgi:hypothetical protein